MKRFTEILDKAVEQRECVVFCTVVETSGSTPLKAGAKMLVWENRKTTGTIGGGNVEKKVIEEAIEINKGGHPRLKEYHLLKEQMCCGGTMKIFIEPMKPQRQLIIFGAGHIGNNISYFAHKLDFKIVIVDERTDMLEQIKSMESEKINLNHRDAFSKIIFDKNTFIVVCTHLHEYDREILAYCIAQPHAYLGMIGSQRKVLVTRKKFLEQNIATAEQLDRVDMPMGFDIGQNSPAEIALGVITKIAAVSNSKNLVQLDLHNNASLLKEVIPNECLNKSIAHGA